MSFCLIILSIISFDCLASLPPNVDNQDEVKVTDSGRKPATISEDDLRSVLENLNPNLKYQQVKEKEEYGPEVYDGPRK